MGRTSNFGVRCCAAISLCFLSGIAAADEPKQFADLIAVNARIYTVNEKQPWAEAIAVRDGKILGVGTNESIRTFAGPSTRVVDAQQHLLLPGFTDCHVHFMDGALSLRRVNVENAKDIVEIQQMVKDFAATHPNDKWVLGRGWYGLQNAVTRQTVDRTPAGGWLPKQRISLSAAIRAYTLDAAYAGRRENAEGSLEPGKVADFIILSQDLFKVDPHQFRETQVLMTVVGGKIAYQAPDLKVQPAAASKVRR